eukprot:scaffold16790_cov204-Skeletonema_marinoi.AAC.10
MVARDTPNVEVPGSSPGCSLTEQSKDVHQCFIIFNIRRLLSGTSTGHLIVRRCDAGCRLPTYSYFSASQGCIHNALSQDICELSLVIQPKTESF